MKRFALFCLAAICLFPSAYALESIVDIQMVRSADGPVVDTIYVDSRHQFQVLIEDGSLMGALHLGFKVFSENGVTWTWDSQPGGYTDTGLAAVTIIPGSRMDTDPWDMTGHIIREINVDGLSSDTISIGGVAIGVGLTSGPLEPMYAIHFTPTGDNEGMICIDSAFIPPSGLFTFAYAAGYAIPNFDGPFCWPVKRFIRGDFDMDGEITVGDPVDIVQFIFQGKPNPGPIEAGDANCDGDTNIGDAIYLIAYIFQYGPAPGCP